MENNNNEIMFFEKGLALIIANLDYAVDLLVASNYQYTGKLQLIIDQLNEVEDFEEWKKINASLQEFVNEVFKNEDLKNDTELFVLLQEPLFINKYLENLLASSNNEDIDEKEVETYLKDNFHTVISKMLDFNGIENVFNQEAIEVLKILVKESKFKDMIEGLGILFAFATNTFTKLEGNELEVYKLLTEADALSSFIFFLNEADAE